MVLSRIWDLSDPSGRGFLTKEGFFVALKLIGLAQEGSEINIKNIYNELPKPPKVVCLIEMNISPSGSNRSLFPLRVTFQKFPLKSNWCRRITPTGP